MKKMIRRFATVIPLACLLVISAGAQTLGKINPSPAEIEQIIRKFTANEGRFREALNKYAFNRSAIINTIGLGGNITGTYRRDSFMTFNEAGERFERILFFPLATTYPGLISSEDLEDLGGVNPFALEPSLIDQYSISYIGRERIDELNLYVFEVRPKVIPDPKKSKLRLFTGRVWVDVDDLFVVKSKGKAVPETKQNKFPVVETWRENIDGKYWFPSFATADDELVFDSGEVLKIRMRVRYSQYRIGRSEVRILDDDPTPTPSPTPKPALQ